MLKGIEEEMDVSESNSVDVLNYKVPELFQTSNAEIIQQQPPSDFFTLVEDLKATNDIQTTTDSSTTKFEPNTLTEETTKTTDVSRYNWVDVLKNKLLSVFQISNTQTVERQSLLDLFNLAGGLQVKIWLF